MKHFYIVSDLQDPTWLRVAGTDGSEWRIARMLGIRVFRDEQIAEEQAVRLMYGDPETFFKEGRPLTRQALPGRLSNYTVGGGRLVFW